MFATRLITSVVYVKIKVLSWLQHPQTSCCVQNNDLFTANIWNWSLLYCQQLTNSRIVLIESLIRRCVFKKRTRRVESKDFFNFETLHIFPNGASGVCTKTWFNNQFLLLTKPHPRECPTICTFDDITPFWYSLSMNHETYSATS